MQKLLKSLAGSRLSKAAIGESITRAKNDLYQARANLQTARQMPQIQTFEQAAQFAKLAVEGMFGATDTVRRYCEQQMQALHFSVPADLLAQLQDIATFAQISATRIAEGVQGARAHAYPEAIVFYIDQITNTLGEVEALQPRLDRINEDIQARVDWAEEAQRVAQEQQRALQQANRERQAYLAQYGGIDPLEVIAQLQSGTYPLVPAGIILRKGETVLFNTTANLSEDRTTTKHVGGSVGYSVPLGHGFRFRVGSYQGHTIRKEQLTHIDGGNLIVTTQRVIFIGRKTTITIQVAKILHTVLFGHGIDIRAENRQKREVFLCPKPLLTNTFVLIACHLIAA